MVKRNNRSLNLKEIQIFCTHDALTKRQTLKEILSVISVPFHINFKL